MECMKEDNTVSYLIEEMVTKCSQSFSTLNDLAQVLYGLLACAPALANRNMSILPGVILG